MREWFRAHQRDLPWRRGRDPYRIWLSEVMLQQTRVAAVVPYYERLLRRFPTVRALARAPLAEVLRQWSGLGYYRRARNLHAAAKEIVARHAGRFPPDYEAALALPGIGRYTAAAILSIAYDETLAVLDGNVARVLARLGAIRGDVRAARCRRGLEETAQQLLDADAPGEWNQAMMELGATVCTPRAPRCEACPLSRWCRARALGKMEQFPARRKMRAPVRMKIAAAVLVDPRGRTLLVKEPGRHDGVLFSRMWQFPAVEVSRHHAGHPGRSQDNSRSHESEDAATALSRHLAELFRVRAKSLVALPHARHAVTFRDVTLMPFLARLEHLPRGKQGRVLPLDQLARLPLSSATRKIAAAAIRSLSPS